AVAGFVAALLPASPGDAFLADFLPLARRVAYFGQFNSLAQVLLKLTCPGVPDVYQGAELWDFSLGDPDNRRRVDYARRRELLADLKKRVAGAGKEMVPLVGDLLSRWQDGCVKLYLIWRMLTVRREHERLFAEGDYQALPATGAKAEHLCAFS